MAASVFLQIGTCTSPGANALGAIWSLSQSMADGGKAALGVIAATHQWVGAANLAKPAK
jgi:hypothetical protein